MTGGGSGIGEAVCQRFAADGARHVVVADLDGDRANRVAGELGAERASAVAVDVSDEAAVTAMVEETLDRHGPVDVLFSNAGYVVRGGMELPSEDFDRQWRVHVMAHVYASRAVLPSMIAQGEGYLLNTASAAGLLTQMNSAPYAVSKAAAVSLAQWLAIAHHHQGIRVSVLCPQAVRTNIVAGVEMEGEPATASADGVVEPGYVADLVADAMREERFLILPHPEVETYVKRKADDIDRWLGGMRRFQSRLYGDLPVPGDWIVAE